MNDLAKAIATIGIWLGIGVIFTFGRFDLYAGFAAFCFAIAGFFSTMAVWWKDNSAQGSTESSTKDSAS